MIGNLGEWTADSFGGGRAVRGGSWLDLSKDARASNRDWSVPAYRDSLDGLRCAQ